MKILSFFTENGIPKTGLSPTIRIRDTADNSLVITDEPLTQVGDGFYSYDFTGYDDTLIYTIRVDGGSELDDADRYQASTNETAGLAEQTDLLLVKTETTNIKTEVDKIEFCKQMLGGYKRKVINNQEIFYNDSGIEIARFNLFDNTGNPSMSSVFERRKA
jgi:hypothetical protein